MLKRHQSKVFGRHCGTQLPVAVSGQGCYIIDETGKQYLDGSGGAAVSCLGHGDPDVIASITSQMHNMTYAHTSFFTSEPAEQLAQLLIENAPEGIDRVYFVSGGSEGVEASIKLARQYYIEQNQPQRTRIIARRQSYHGNTLGALAAGGNQWRRQPFAPLLAETSHIAPCYAYRGCADGESEEAYGIRVANELEAEILRLEPDTVMAFLAEPVVGATLGAVPAVKGYFNRIREICDAYGILLILDEVMCGMGRCGNLFACDREQVRPDILIVAKSLGAGYQPVGAMLASHHIYDVVAAGSGYFQHGHTYNGHPVACAAGLAVVQKILNHGLIEQVQQQGKQMQQALMQTFAEHPHVGDIRGRGLLWGMEFVKDRNSKQPFEPNQQVHKKLKLAAFEAGLACYTMGGTIDGVQGDHVLLAPPYIIRNKQVDELVDKLHRALNKVTG